MSTSRGTSPRPLPSSEGRMPAAAERIIGVGLDLVEVARIESAITRRPRIVDRLFSEEEKEFCSSLADPWENWAARFAAKEAVMKSLGAGPARMPWKSISLVRQGGRPSIRLEGAALEYARSLGCSRIEISIAHEGGMAGAVAVAVGAAGSGATSEAYREASPDTDSAGGLGSQPDSAVGPEAHSAGDAGAYAGAVPEAADEEHRSEGP